MTSLEEIDKLSAFEILLAHSPLAYITSLCQARFSNTNFHKVLNLTEIAAQHLKTLKSDKILYAIKNSTSFIHPHFILGECSQVKLEIMTSLKSKSEY